MGPLHVGEARPPAQAWAPLVVLRGGPNLDLTAGQLGSAPCISLVFEYSWCFSHGKCQKLLHGLTVCPRPMAGAAAPALPSRWRFSVYDVLIRLWTCFSA